MSTAHDLARRGDLKALQKVLKSQKKNEPPLVHAKDARGMTPLHCAAEGGHLEIVQFLVDKGAKVNVIDKEGWSPLHCAAQEKNMKICLYLLTEGCNPNIHNSEGTTAMHYLCRNRLTPDTREVLLLLLKKGGEINATNKFGESALHQAALRVADDMVKLLLELKADVNLVNQHGETPLHKAARVGAQALTVAKTLIAGGANPLITGTHGLASDVVEDKTRDKEIYSYLKGEEERAQQVTPKTPTTNSPARLAVSSPNALPESRKLQRKNSFTVGLPVARVGSTSPSPLAGASKVVEPIEGSNTQEEVDSAPNRMVKWSDNYRIEVGTPDAVPEVKLQLEPYVYRDEFANKKPHHYTGTLKANREERVVFVVLEEAEGDSYPALLVTSHGYSKVSVPVATLEELPQEKAGLPFAEKIIEALEDEYTLYLLRPYSSLTFGKDLVKMESDDSLKLFTFNVGVLYLKPGQTLERDMFDNEHGSPQFEEFLTRIGEKITLQGWSGYRGNLDVTHNSKGTHAYYTEWNNLEIMYHVSTYLPYNSSDVDKLARSGLLRNDMAIIVFQEYGAQYVPDSIRSRLNHVIACVMPLPEKATFGETQYQLAVVSRPEVAPFGPTLPANPVVLTSQLKDFLLTKVINGYVASGRTEAFDVAYREPRKYQLEQLHSLYPDGKRVGDKPGEKGAADKEKKGLLGLLIPGRTSGRKEEKVTASRSGSHTERSDDRSESEKSNEKDKKNKKLDKKEKKKDKDSGWFGHVKSRSAERVSERRGSVSKPQTPNKKTLETSGTSPLYVPAADAANGHSEG